MRTHPEGADLFHADIRTDIIKLVVAYRNFANAPKQMTDSYSGCSVGSIAILTDIRGEGLVGDVFYLTTTSVAKIMWRWR
jgi:hypothetical protein